MAELVQSQQQSDAQSNEPAAPRGRASTCRTSKACHVSQSASRSGKRSLAASDPFHTQAPVRKPILTRIEIAGGGVGAELVADESGEVADAIRREVGQFCLLLASLCDGAAGVIAHNMPVQDGSGCTVALFRRYIQETRQDPPDLRGCSAPHARSAGREHCLRRARDGGHTVSIVAKSG